MRRESHKAENAPQAEISKYECESAVCSNRARGRYNWLRGSEFLEGKRRRATVST